jgi:hypothetical protein
MNSKSIILDDKAVFGLLNDTKFLDQFPSIKEALEAAKNKANSHIVKQGCKPCQVRSKQIAIDLMAVKKSIVRFCDEDKLKIKEFLKTDKVIIIFNNDKNVLSQIDF